MKLRSGSHWLYFIGAPWACVALLRNSGVIQYGDLSRDLGQFLGFFLTLAVLFYCLGLLIGRQTIAGRSARPAVSNSDVSTTTIFCALYIGLTWIDFFVVKGGSIFAITEIREEDNLTGSRMSVLGGVMALISAAPYVLMALILFVNKNGGLLTSKKPTMLATLGIATSFLSGGRNAFLIGATVIALQHLLVQDARPTKQLNRRGVLLAALMGLCVAFSLYIFVERETRQGVDTKHILHYFSVKWGVDVAQLDTDHPLANVAYSILAITAFYFSHALSFLDQYFTSNISPSFFGSYNFPILAKAVEIVFSVETFSAVHKGLLLPGVYLTLPGSLFVDFGYSGSIFFGSILALLTGFLYAQRRRLGFFGLLFTCFLLATWILAPLYSLFGISNGFSFIAIVMFMAAKKTLIRCIR